MKTLRTRLFTVLALAIFTIASLNAQITVNWKQGATLGWNEMALFSWGATPVGSPFGDWPGIVITPDADGWYSYTFAAGETTGNLIFNNNDNGQQVELADFSNFNGSFCFELTSGGSGAGGTYNKIDCPEGSGPALGITFKWQQPGNEWSDMYVYSYGGSPENEPLGWWKNTLVTPDADGWYSVTFLEGQTPGNLMIHNGLDGALEQKVNIGNHPEIEENFCYQVGTTDASVVSVTCPGGTNIDTPDAATEIAIYPNPASDFIYAEGAVAMTVYGFSGSKLSSGTDSVNISALAKGSYLAKAIFADGSVVSQIIIKK